MNSFDAGGHILMLVHLNIIYWMPVLMLVFVLCCCFLFALVSFFFFFLLGSHSLLYTAIYWMPFSAKVFKRFFENQVENKIKIKVNTRAHEMNGIEIEPYLKSETNKVSHLAYCRCFYWHTHKRTHARLLANESK